MSEIKTAFKNATVPKASFDIKPTLGTDPASKPNSSDAGVSGSVKPVELPFNTLKHGTK